MVQDFLNYQRGNTCPLSSLSSLQEELLTWTPEFCLAWMQPQRFWVIVMCPHLSLLLRGLCTDVPISPGRPPGTHSLSRVRNMSDSSVDTKRQPNKRKLIRRAAASPVSSGPLSSQSPGTRSQGWDPGGTKVLLHPVPPAQPHPPRSELRHPPTSHSRIRDSKSLLF